MLATLLSRHGVRILEVPQATPEIVVPADLRPRGLYQPGQGIVLSAPRPHRIFRLINVGGLSLPVYEEVTDAP